MKSNVLESWAFLLALLASLALVAVGFGFILDNADAAKLFGIPLAGGPTDTYVTVAAVRDVAFGALTLVFTLLRDRRAVGLCLLLGAIIPLGDGIVVLRHSTTPLMFLPLHWGGVIACVAFSLLLLRPGRKVNDPPSQRHTPAG